MPETIYLYSLARPPYVIGVAWDWGMAPARYHNQETTMANQASVKIAPTTTPAPTTTKAKPAKYAETDIITLLAEKNPKRAASAKRFAAYKTGMTVGAYLDACKALHPEEERYRWRADLSWDVTRKYIEVNPAAK